MLTLDVRILDIIRCTLDAENYFFLSKKCFLNCTFSYIHTTLYQYKVVNRMAFMPIAGRIRPATVELNINIKT
jgi:hypothetical protein